DKRRTSSTSNPALRSKQQAEQRAAAAAADLPDPDDKTTIRASESIPLGAAMAAPTGRSGSFAAAHGEHGNDRNQDRSDQDDPSVSANAPPKYLPAKATATSASPRSQGPTLSPEDEENDLLAALGDEDDAPPTVGGPAAGPSAARGVGSGFDLEDVKTRNVPR